MVFACCFVFTPLRTTRDRGIHDTKTTNKSIASVTPRANTAQQSVVSAGRVKRIIDRDSDRGPYTADFVDFFFFVYSFFFHGSLENTFRAAAIKELKKFQHLYRLYALERPFSNLLP